MESTRIEKIALVGLGAVGAVVASELQTAKNITLYCVVDEKRKERYLENGIYINGQKQNYNFVTPDQLEPVDLIIIATKNLQIEEALSEIKNGVGKNTYILSLLNGIQSEKEIEKMYGVEKTLYGFIINITSINLNGKIDCSSNGTIVFGEKDNTTTERIENIKALFTDAGIDFKNPQNIQLEMWKKFLINTTFNSLGALCRSPYGGFNFEEMQALARKIGSEVIQIANAEKIPLTSQMLEDDISLTCSYSPHGKCSMLQDMEALRPTENDFFCGTIIQLGKKHNIPTPFCEFMYQLIKGTELARTI